METARRPANVKWFSNRIKSGRKRSSPRQIVLLRIHDFERLFRSRYGVTLPDDDSGRDDIEPVMHHFAAMPQGARRAAHWLEVWAPWLTLREQRKFISDGIAGARTWKADQLAWRYRITDQERTTIGLTTIAAVDRGKGARTKRRRERERQRKAHKRKLAGAIPRARFEATSAARTKPWITEGIGRATWYRRRRETLAAHETARETGAVTA